MTRYSGETVCKYNVLLSELVTVLPRGGLAVLKGADRQSIRLCQKKKKKKSPLELLADK